MNIDLGANTASTIMGYVSTMIDDFSSYIALILGVVIAVFVIQSLIGLMVGNNIDDLNYDGDVPSKK